MSAPAVTVLMTVFNAGVHLEAAIASIASQTYRDWEFLVVDDGSTDGSADVVEAWARRDRRIQLIRNTENKGQTACLNQGLAAARGRWIARQDADDMSRPERLERQVAAVTANPSIVLLGTCGWMIDCDGRVIGLLDAPVTPDEISWSAPFLNPFIHTAVLARTDVVRDLGGYDKSYRIAQDYELWTRIAARHETANLAERLVAYRHLGTSLSKAGSHTAFAEARQVSQREAKRAFGHDLTPDEDNLLARFREGRLGTERRAFWRLYDELRQTSFPHAHLSRITSLHHLKVAGASDAVAAEIFAAFRSDPSATTGWLAERLMCALRGSM